MPHQPAERRHKVLIGDRHRRGNIINTFQFGMIEEPLHRTAYVFYMYPAIHLLTTTLATPQSPFQQIEIGQPSHPFPKVIAVRIANLSRKRRPLRIQSRLPALAHLHRETILDLPRILILRPVLRMPVDRSR